MMPFVISSLIPPPQRLSARRCLLLPSNTDSMSTPIIYQRTWFRPVLRLVAWIFLTGVIINFPFVIHDGVQFLYKGTVYKKLTLGRERQQAAELLRADRVWCGLTDGSSNSCRFGDFWTTYSIEVDPKSNKIARRGINLMPRMSLLQRLGF